MSIARTWLMMSLAAGLACSSSKTEPAQTGSGATGAGAAGSAHAGSGHAGSAQAPAADDRVDASSLGALAFTLTEGTPAARAHFQRGLLALHSFWYDEARQQFQAAITADPTMNMAHWGVAMSHLKLLWGEDDLTAARKALSRMPNPDLLSPREQAWVMAAVELVRAGDVRSSRRRFATALEGLHAQFPDDESATFLAVALLSTTRPEDPDTVEVRKRAAALAGAVFERNPRHPGAAHYFIHAYDTPELAALALPHARAYARIAPEAFHARHMPAHIFSRLGMWAEAIASCQSAWDASLAAAKRLGMPADSHDFHSMTWLVEMNFELGHRAAADAALATFASAVRAGLGRQLRALYATQVASYMKRTGDWARVDELLAPLDAPAIEQTMPDAPVGAASAAAGGPVPPSATPPSPTTPTSAPTTSAPTSSAPTSPAPTSPAPTTDAPTSPAPTTDAGTRGGPPASHCAPAPAASPLALLEAIAILDARTRAAAMQGDTAGAARLRAELAGKRAEVRPYLLTVQPADMVRRIDAANARYDQAITARAAGNDRALLPLLRATAADGDLEVGGESNPSGFLIHEDLADTLLRIGKAREAVVEYERVLAAHPGRAHALLGAARAKAAAGDTAGARAVFAQLATQWTTADAGTPGLADVRAAATPP